MKYINDVLAATVLCSAVLALAPSRDKSIGRGVRVLTSLVLLLVILSPLTRISAAVDGLETKLRDFFSLNEKAETDLSSPVNIKLAALSQTMEESLLHRFSLSEGTITVTLTADVSDPSAIRVTEVTVNLYTDVDEGEIKEYVQSLGFESCTVVKGDPPCQS